MGIQHSVQGGENTFPMHSALRILHAASAQRCAARAGVWVLVLTTPCATLRAAALPGHPKSAPCSSAPALSPVPGRVYGTGEHNCCLSMCAAQALSPALVLTVARVTVSFLLERALLQTPGLSHPRRKGEH